MTAPSMLHATAHLLTGLTVLGDPLLAWWLWLRLRHAFPRIIAGCLMPDHLHLILFGVPDAVRLRLGAVLSGFTRHAGERRLWLPIPEPRVIPDAKHLARQVRYTHLNPCRAGLVRDPLSLPWSTHRGVIGAEVDPWVSADDLADWLGWPRGGFEQRFHAYVSRDPSTDVAGTPFPIVAPTRDWPSIPLETIGMAGLSATPWSTRAERRRTIVRLAASQGWTDPAVVARSMFMTAQSVRRMRKSGEPALLAPALLCLGDERLRSSSAWIKRYGNASAKAPPPWMAPERRWRTSSRAVLTPQRS